MPISHQFPSHLCSASQGIKIEEAQIPLFQVSLQFADESSMAWEFQLQGFFETETEAEVQRRDAVRPKSDDLA